MDKYYRYQLSYPIEGNKIYKSRSLNKVVKKCLLELEQNNINKDIFCIINLDNKIEYRFKKKKKKKNKKKNNKSKDNEMYDLFEGIDLQKMKNENNRFIL